MSSTTAWRRALALIAGLCLVWLTGCGLLERPRRLTSPDADVIDHPALIRVVACSAGLPLAEALREAYLRRAPGVVIDIRPFGVESDEDLLRQESADLAVVVRPYDAASGLPSLYEGDGNLYPVFLALDAVGVVVHERNAVSDLATADLAALMGGYRPDWSALGGEPGQPVLVVPEGSSGLRLFEPTITGAPEITPAARLVPDDRAVLRAVRDEEKAVGLASRAWAQGRYGNGVKLLALDGVMPGASTLRNGAYPFTYTLVLLRSPDASDDVDALIAYCVSAEARRLAQQQYVLPR